MSPLDTPWTRLTRLAASRHGLVTRRQARWCGLTDDQIDHRLRSGELVTLRPGVLGVAGVPPSWEQTARSALLASGESAMLTGPSAAKNWKQTPRPEAQGIHVLTPTTEGRARRPGIIAQRSSLIVPADVGRHNGLKTTSPARTLVECSGALGAEATGEALDDAMRRDLVTLEGFRATATRLMVPGRPHRLVLGAVLARRLPGYDPGDSDLEVDAMARMRRAGLPVPAQQHPVVVEGRTLHIDLALPDLMIGIELEGWEWHRYRTSFDRDRRRLSWLAAGGWSMLVPTTETIGDLVPQLQLLIPRQRAILRPTG